MIGISSKARVAAVSAVLAFGAAFSHAFTVATFSDPSNGSTPLFNLTLTQLTGGWSATGLDLQIPVAGVSLQDATFTMTPLTRTGSGALGAGTISFYDKLGANVLDIQFSGAQVLAPYVMGASFLNFDNVQFSSPLIPNAQSWKDPQFAFSFSNPQSVPGGMAFTASFTSSAVPEPASLAVLGVGVVAVLSRRRKRR